MDCFDVFKSFQDESFKPLISLNAEFSPLNRSNPFLVQTERGRADIKVRIDYYLHGHKFPNPVTVLGIVIP